MKTVPLYKYPDMGSTDAGLAIAEDFKRVLTPIVNTLLDAGFDPAHLETLLTREVWTTTMVFAKLDRSF